LNNNKFKQIVVLSGKGGTGKTTFTAAISKILGNKVVIDCDVDAANLFLLLNPEIKEEKDYSGAKKAFINSDICNQCGICESVCRFDAIHNYTVDPVSCEGCGFCFRACPDHAISFDFVNTGKIYEGNLNDQTKFFYAKLNPGEGNSGKLVSEIKKLAIQNITDEIKWMIVDGPPGIGCPVNASLAGADFILLIAEPTLSGFHDLERIISLLKSFKFKFGIIINKYDLNLELTQKITELAEINNSEVIDKYPYDENFIKSLRDGKTVIEISDQLKAQFEILVEKIISKLAIN